MGKRCTLVFWNVEAPNVRRLFFLGLPDRFVRTWWHSRTVWRPEWFVRTWWHSRAVTDKPIGVAVQFSGTDNRRDTEAGRQNPSVELHCWYSFQPVIIRSQTSETQGYNCRNDYYPTRPTRSFNAVRSVNQCGSRRQQHSGHSQRSGPNHQTGSRVRQGSRFESVPRDSPGSRARGAVTLAVCPNKRPNTERLAPGM